MAAVAPAAATLPSSYRARSPNLGRPMSELVADGQELVVTDPAYTQGTALWLEVRMRA